MADVRRKRKNADGSVNLQLPLVSLVVPVDDLNGKVVSRKPVTGTITVKVQIAPSAYTMCGWMWKMSEKLLGGNDWKKRWFVLTDGYLVYFNSESGLETAKHVINCSKISKIEMADAPVKGRIAMKVHYTAEQGNASSFWQLDFDEDAAPAVKKMWERKLFNNAKAVPNPEIESLKKKFDIIKAKASVDESSRRGAVSSKKRAGNRKSIF